MKTVHAGALRVHQGNGWGTVRCSEMGRRQFLPKSGEEIQKLIR